MKKYRNGVDASLPMSEFNNPSARQWRVRGAYFMAVIAAMALGLSSRLFADRLPAFVVEHFGDALWASMIYFGFRACFAHMKILVALWCSIAFCFAIEFSQLYQADWINQIRGTVLGGLILGKGFLVVDLMRYSAGIVVSSLFDQAWSRRKRS